MQGGPLNATEEELAAFEEMRPMVQQGFGGTFDQLEGYLEARNNSLQLSNASGDNGNRRFFVVLLF
ncbi:hypothetical protein [Paenibacillus sp. GP183]|uniref:hypothetical protein n=1 Tax=Paenibacillus sp. GP183 TaxID=1882751 RepID=UPI00209AB39D|nr:hypothetical protein [Paenibacillus sp. GP183]